MDVLSDTRNAEVTIVGSGPGGSVTACILSEAGLNVCILEEGQHHPPDPYEPFSLEEMTHTYRNGGITGTLGNPRIAYAEARCVGGGSEINGGLYHRPPVDVLEQWRREFGVEAASERDLIPHLEASERDLHISYMPGTPPASSLKLHEGATRLGWSSQEVPRWVSYGPSGPDGISKGTRQSMTRTYIPRAIAAGATLVPNTRVNRLRQDGQGWLLEATSIESGRSRAVRVRSNVVFIAGGAIQTPALLRRSGIRKNVGNTLEFHTTAKVVAEFREQVNSEGMGVPVHQVKQFAPRFSLGCSVSAPPHLAMALAGYPDPLRRLAKDWKRMAVYYAMTHGGVGNVRTVPFYRDALVRYSLGREQYTDLADGLRHLCQALLSSGALTLWPSLTGVSPITRPDDIEHIPNPLPPNRSSLMSVHLFSSCRMGEDRTKCAADSFGKVHGHRNLYIADASLLCTSPGVNPQGTILAIARRNASRFVGAL